MYDENFWTFFVSSTCRLHALNQLLKYVTDTKDKGIQIRKSEKGPFKIIAYADSNYANDLDTRRSVAGYIIYVNNTV